MAAGRELGSRVPLPAPENLVFFGAVPEELAVQEVLIEGRPRGALSSAFARAVEGLADKNGDALLTAQELMMQVPEMVRVLSENRQTPRIAAGARSLVPLFRLPLDAPPATKPMLPKRQRRPAAADLAIADAFLKAVRSAEKGAVGGAG
jgi:hypothetical protein